MDFTTSMTGPQRMTNKFLFLMISFGFLCNSCSFISKKVESIISQEADSNAKKEPTSRPSKVNKKNLFCFEKNKINLLLEDDSTVKYYRSLIPTLFDSKFFSFIQKAAMLSLIEMSRRPDEASPSARLQFHLRFNNKNYYYDFRPTNLEDNTRMSYLKGVEILIKNFDASKNLKQIAETLDTLLPLNMNVSPELENFLQSNRDELYKNEYLAETFFKGDEVLTKHESFKRMNLKKLINLFYSNKTSDDTFYESSKNSLFDIPPVGQKDELKCNVDITKDNALKEELFFSKQKKSHYFGLKDANNFFIAVSSSVVQKPFKEYDKTYFFKSRPAPTPQPFCQFKNNLHDITLFSTAGRNSAQHLKHLISYDINQTDSFQSLGELLNFSRHLFLIGPDRILYESKRGRKSQLDFFLSMNFPIYHVDSLGDIIGAASFKNEKREELSLIIDDRSQAKIWCGP